MNITKGNTPFLLIGDINARIGNISEFMQHEKININCPPSRSVRETKRNNCDTTQNKKGMKLIELCKSYEMQIANGRFPGDYWGNFTHHNKNKGASTVDLVLISDNLFHITEDFKVLPHTELSDHGKIVITICNTKKVVDSRTNKYKWLNKKQVYKWNPDPSNFIKAFNSSGVKEITKQCNDYLEAGLIDSSGSLIQEIFIATAESSVDLKTDYKNNRKRNNKKHSKKWFDAECYKLRKETRRYAILKHNNPTDKNIAQSHGDILKTFKKLSNSKKYSGKRKRPDWVNY